jgi:hypothetical protein
MTCGGWRGCRRLAAGVWAESGRGMDTMVGVQEGKKVAFSRTSAVERIGGLRATYYTLSLREPELGAAWSQASLSTALLHFNLFMHPAVDDACHPITRGRTLVLQPLSLRQPAWCRDHRASFQTPCPLGRASPSFGLPL